MITSAHFDKLAAERAKIEPSRIAGLVAGLERWTVVFIAWRAERAAIAALDSMSDHELKDIGLVRSDIGRAVKVLPT
jgi:uncharacterized protein YjiS (DUF1127 family)